MPVSSPSYFPPARSDGTVVGQTAGQNAIGDRSFFALAQAGANSAANDLIVIGANALDAGLLATDPISGAPLGGVVAIGTSTLSGLTTHFSNSGITTPTGSVAIGQNAFAAVTNAGPNVVIGASAFGAWVGDPATSATCVDANVVIGNEAMGLVNQGSFIQGPRFNVVIGYQTALASINPNFFVARSVLIGAKVCRDTGIDSPGAGTSQVNDCVIIGYQAGIEYGGGHVGAASGFSVVIGSGSLGAGQGTQTNPFGESVAIGASCNIGGPTSACVMVGKGAQISGTGSVVIGNGTAALGDGNILIGQLAQTGQSSTTMTQKLILGNSAHTGIYVDMATGNTLLGDSVAGGTIRNFQNATNVLKLLNGTVGTANPVGGGYFYVTGGALHWVGSAGTNTAIAPA